MRRFAAPTYAVELGLDHLTSDVHLLGESAIAGNRWSWAQLASDELANLGQIERDLAQCPVSEAERKRFQEYIDLTRHLLTALADIRPGSVGE